MSDRVITRAELAHWAKEQEARALRAEQQRDALWAEIKKHRCRKPQSFLLHDRAASIMAEGSEGK